MYSMFSACIIIFIFTASKCVYLCMFAGDTCFAVYSISVAQNLRWGTAFMWHHLPINKVSLVSFKEIFWYFGHFLAESSMRGLTPLSCPHATYEAGTCNLQVIPGSDSVQNLCVKCGFNGKLHAGTFLAPNAHTYITCIHTIWLPGNQDSRKSLRPAQK